MYWYCEEKFIFNQFWEDDKKKQLQQQEQLTALSESQDTTASLSTTTKVWSFWELPSGSVVVTGGNAKRF